MLATIPVDRIEPGRRLRGINEAQVSALAGSIADVGLLNPISVFPRQVIRDGVSVDGYGLIAGAHRLRACERLGMVEIDAQVLDMPDLQRQIAECDENLCGTVLTAAERALFTRRRKDAYEALHPETRRGVAGAEAKHGRATDNLSVASFAKDTAQKTGVDERTVHRDASRGSISERALATLRGTHLDRGVYLDELKRLDEDEQVVAVQRDLDAAKATVALAKEIRGARQKVGHQDRLAHMEAVAERGQTSAPGKLSRLYPVYYLDPPWKFGVRSEVTGREKSAENHYPTMTTDEIVALLTELIGGAEPAVIFCWATNPMLRDGLRVLEACGFTYVHHWIWDKEVAGTGYWGRDRHELLLIGRRGDIAAPLPGSQPETVYREKKGKHSAKPDFFAETIERLFPGIARLEMFSRRARPGWDAWGFEAESKDHLKAASDAVDAVNKGRVPAEDRQAVAEEIAAVARRRERHRRVGPGTPKRQSRA